MRKIYTIIMLCCLYSGVLQAVEVASFSSDLNDKRYKSFLVNTRCMICENQNIAESTSMFSDNMKEWLYEAIESGQTDYEIKTALTDRFGESIFYSPPFQANTFLLWGLPGLFLLLGLLTLYSALRGHTRSNPGNHLDCRVGVPPRNDDCLKKEGIQ